MPVRDYNLDITGLLPFRAIHLHTTYTHTFYIHTFLDILHITAIHLHIFTYDIQSLDSVFSINIENILSDINT